MIKQPLDSSGETVQSIDSPQVGIVIPAYNAGEVIVRCLDSLQGQTLTDWCAIIVDDGSSDDTREKILAYQARDARFHLLQGQHAGAAAARNQGLDALEQLSPQYITFLDSDDYLELDALEAMLETAERTGADVVHCKYYSEYTNGHRDELSNLFPPGAVYTRDMFPRTVYWKMMTGIQMNHICTKLYRASLVRGMRLNAALRTGEDLMMNVEIFTKAHSYAYLARPLYHYIRDYEQSLTNASLKWGIKLRSNWQVSLRMLELLPQWGMDRLKYRVCVVCRPIVLICSKSYRLLRARLVRLPKTSS